MDEGISSDEENTKWPCFCLPPFIGLGDVAGRLLELQESCESLTECHDLIAEYADKLKINHDFDRVRITVHEVTMNSDTVTKKKNTNL